MNENVIEGFRFAAVAAGVKKAGTERLDLGLIAADCPAVAAGVTTTNLVAAAPVQITRSRLAGGLCQAVLVNSGNANAYTGEKGKQDALVLTRQTAECMGIDQDLVVPMSTGVIGNPMPMDRIRPRIPELVGKLSPGGFPDVAQAIMTTDTRPKTVFVEGHCSHGSMKMAGMAKGAGMIAPSMATMLAVILTDIRVETAFLKKCLVEASARTFNCITIDGDTSTNDTLIVLAGGRPEARTLGDSPSDREAFASMLNEACMTLARAIVMDGEGATKLVEVVVTGAPSEEAARIVARKIAESPLVKTAFHGEDPNWGRIICAAGRAGVPFDPERVDLCIGDVPIVKHGILVQEDWETPAHRAMKAGEFSVLLDLKTGNGEARFLTSDMSEEYVSINADYRS
ncbi:MAG TPA: bifunctional glutamate N-acetyltransferase/amino-acid acetyltransferase ArgJ [Desulfomonilaceae bacterium]|nr:bifunctional glutamate N-acetyltransferase/amino-acid acetyltransferase ArgJ [Desulfomonilaceae bacterium]